MDDSCVVATLKPAMASPQRPDWPSAKWVGVLDLPAALAPSIQLMNANGYRKARLLVRQQFRPVAFVEADVVDNIVDGVRLSEMVSCWNRGIPADLEAPPAEDLPFITVVICTRNRAASLQEALASVLACDYPRFEVIVVENSPSDCTTAGYVSWLADSRVRTIAEPMAGLSIARNTGVLAARGDVVAFTDDDVVVDPRWLRRLGSTIGATPAAACVTGLVCGGELRTPEQQWFENQVSWSRNLTRTEFDITRPPPGDKVFPFHPALYGTGANFAIRRSVLLEVGGFDEALGAGSPVGAGEDIDTFVRVLVAGHTLIYEPSAVVWHRHRAEMSDLLTQLHEYSLGMGAWLTKVACDRSLSRLAVRRIWPAMRHFRTLTSPPEREDLDATRTLRRIRFTLTVRGSLAFFKSRRRKFRPSPLRQSGRR